MILIFNAGQSISEENRIGNYNAKQRVVYTEGDKSMLMIGDPEKNHDRYANGQALPTLLFEGWKIVSVTPAPNSSSESGKTIIVLEIPVPPYDRVELLWLSERVHFPKTDIAMLLTSRKIKRKIPKRKPNEPVARDPSKLTSDLVLQVFIKDKLFKEKKWKFYNEIKKLKESLVKDVWVLGNGYSIQIVDLWFGNEMIRFTVRLFSTMPEGVGPS